MTGLCPKGDTACVPGPKWTPNDPLFFLHHAVRLISSLFVSSYLTTWAPQMVDKIWYDWQKRDTRNKYAYGGGSRQATTSFASFIAAPNGLSPYLGVSPSTDIKPERSLILSLLVRVPASQ